VVPGFAGDDEAFPRLPGVPVAADVARPWRCSDRSWYRRTARDVWVDADAALRTVPPTYDHRALQEACVEDYVDDGTWGTP